MKTNYRLWTLLLIVGSFMVFCSSNSNKVKPQILSQDFYEYSGYETAQSFIVKDQKTWNEVHDKIFQNQEPKPGHSVIDFENYNLVIFAFGEKPTGGYQYEVKSYVQEGNTLDFRIVSPSPDPFTPVTMALTYPLVVCKILATDAQKVTYDLKN